MPVLTIPRVLAMWISLAVLAAALYLLWSWDNGQLVRDADGILRRVRGPDWRLYAGLALLAWSFLGRFVVLALIPGKAVEPRVHRGEGQMVGAAGNLEIRVDQFGHPAAPTLVLTHGWGLNSTAWARTTAGLEDRFHLVTWDLPGLGRSKRPRDDRYSIDRFAEALGSVIAVAGDGRVVLVGHSIGGMTTETLWRACPAALRRRVAGIVLLNTTFMDPLRTMWLHRLWTALKKPLIEPLNGLAIVFSPFLWLSSWQSYLSGSSQVAMRLAGFGRHASRGEVDFAARLACKASPAVQAKGNLAMLHWSAADLLPQIDVPVLIVAGERDIVTHPDASETMASAIPDARLIRVEGVGHMGFMERADVYNEAIADFAEAAFRGERVGISRTPQSGPELNDRF